MPTPKRTRATSRKAAASAPPEAVAEDESLDGTLDRWSETAARELAAWGLGTSAAFLRGVQALQEAQLDAAREACRLHEQAAAQLGTARSASDLAQLQMTLAQSDGQVALQALSRMGEAASRQAFDGWKDGAAGWAQLHGAAWMAATRWFGGLAQQPTDPELIEAEVEHVVSPFTASPFVWPAQEAARQAMTLAGSAWNDWLSWSGRWAEAGQGAARG
jgi:hypothetical protein